MNKVASQDSEVRKGGTFLLLVFAIRLWLLLEAMNPIRLVWCAVINYMVDRKYYIKKTIFRREGGLTG